MNTIEVSDLTKIYRSARKKNDIRALNNFSISIESGSVFGLLGPNGAGKTTLIKILLGIAYPTSGKAKILGQSIYDYKIKSRIGYLPENHKYPNYLKGEDVLKYFGRLSGKDDKFLSSKINELLAVVKMEKWRKTKIKKYSKGMMQRLGLAQSLINDPELIFLDEPTDGVDPIGRKEIRDIILQLKNEGKTIFLNSHLLSEVEMITDRVAILNNGELIKEGTVQDLTTDKETYEITFAENVDLQEKAFLFDADKIERKEGNKILLKINDSDELNKFLDKFRSEKMDFISVVPVKTSLENMFISLIEDSNKTKK